MYYIISFFFLKDLAFLPGGFPSCCLSTCLDPHESSVIREIAGFVFANLLSFCEPHTESLATKDVFISMYYFKYSIFYNLVFLAFTIRTTMYVECYGNNKTTKIFI